MMFFAILIVLAFVCVTIATIAEAIGYIKEVYFE